jgi:GT2 family glycosyltransferase
MSQTSHDQLSEPFVVISILNWTNYEDTIQCIKSIQQLAYKNFEILICDNASPNDSFEQLRKTFPALQVHAAKENNGFAAGHYLNYLRAKEMNAAAFWILNADLEVDMNALSRLVEVSSSLPNCVFGSVSLQPANHNLVDFGGAPLTEASKQELHYNTWKNIEYSTLLVQYPTAYEVESLEGSSFYLQMDIIAQHGFMHLDFFMYAEETDYCYRLREKGVRSMLVSQSLVYHKNEGSTNSNPQLKIIPSYYRRRNALRFQHDHFHFSRWNMLTYQSGFWGNLKALVKGKLSKNKEFSYYYALACFHAAFGIKGKRIYPEKLI